MAGPQLMLRLRSRRSANGRFEEALPPWIPHGERGENSEIEDTLPLPRCTECLDRIYYEQRAWHHAELVNDHDHEADPEVAVGRNFRKNRLTQPKKYERITT